MNVLNELTNAPSPVGNQNYDSNGNLLTNHVAAHSKWVYFYDDENHLIELIRTNSISDIKATAFVYDGIGRLRERLEYSPTPQGFAPSGDWTLDSETHYIYDGRRVIQERDSNNVPTVSYTRGNDLSVSLEGAGGIGGLLARSSGYSSGNWTSHADYYADGNGNVTSLIDGNQSVVASYRYDPFGNTISKSGTLANANVYRFSSKEVHVNSGMYYYGFRFYDPNMQRWINRDPIEEEGGINLFVFCNQNAVKDFDALGLYNTCGHNSLYNSALKDIAPSDDLKKIKKSSAEQDNPFKGGLSPEHANEHGMRSAKQSKEDAHQAGDNLTDDYLNRAIAAERSDQHSKAMSLLGKGMHLITDRLSPAHRGEQKWPNPLNPLNWPADFIVHPLREIFPSSAARRQSDQQLRDYYDKFLQGCE